MNRSTVLNETYEGATYAEPLSGLRVSWGAILAGALAIVAVSGILMALAVAIILTATNATMASLQGSLIALFICAIATTLVGGFVGGWLAGYLPGNRSSLLGGVHAFLAWALAFVVMTAVYLAAAGGIVRTGATLSMTAASATMQTAGSTVGGVAGGQMTLDQKAENLLESLGYPPGQAQQMVDKAQSSVQNTLQGNTQTPAAPSAASVFGPIISLGAGLAWAWWGTWLVAAALAVLGGLVSAKVLSRSSSRPRRTRPEERVLPVTPLPEPT